MITAARKDPPLQRAVPVSGDLRGYGAGKARGDLIAALTVAALAVPSAMAYAELAGLTPVAGLYALLLPTVAYALLGSSRQLVVGPEGAISALVGATVLASAVAGSKEAAELAAMLALLVAACFVVARIARLGWIADRSAACQLAPPAGCAPGPRARVTSAGALSSGGALSRGCCSYQRA